jgi:ethanolamine ammonia-lyase large subunit
MQRLPGRRLYDRQNISALLRTHFAGKLLIVDLATERCFRATGAADNLPKSNATPAACNALRGMNLF